LATRARLRTFLKLNGLELTATKEGRVLTFWNLAAGEIPEAQQQAVV
jgi:prophage maintenance system killer protein